MSEDEEKLAQPTKNKGPDRVNKLYGKERRSKGVKTVPSKSIKIDDDYSPEVLFLETVKDFGIHRTVGSADNYFNLNLVLMYEYVHQMFILMNDNPKVEKYFKWFNPPALISYITTLVYIQIVRAQVAVKRLQNTGDGKFIRAFFREFPEESLVIPGPLVPFFNQIAGVILDDPKFGNIAPAVPQNWATISAFTSGSQSDANYPQFMLSLIYAEAFANNKMWQLNTSTELFFTKNTSATAAERTVFNVDFETVASATVARVQSFWRPGTNYGFDFNQIENTTATAGESPRYVHSITKKRALAQRFAPLITHFATLQNTDPLHGIDGLMTMKTNFKWFRCLLTHAIEFNKFWKGTRNLSQIDTTTGLSRSFQGITDNVPAGSIWLVAPTTLVPPGRFPQFTVRYYSSRGECSDLDVRKAQMTAIHQRGSQNRFGFNAPVGSTNHGPFWSTTEDQAEIVTDSSDPTSLVQTLLQDKLFIVNPYSN
nr:coat protein [Armillaria gallica partitivirus 1]